MLPKISVIIPTKNRIDDNNTIKSLESMINQTFTPDEIIIVDASDTEVLNTEIKKHFTSTKTKIKYINDKSRVNRARNIGIKNSSGNIVFFLDDDVILEKDFMEEIIKVFENDPDKKIGGVMGTIMGISRKQKWINSLINRIFFLSEFGDGKFKLSGTATWPHGCDKIKNTEFLGGGLTAYRREVLNEFKFDEKMYSVMDDNEFSYRVSRKYQNIYTPYAKLYYECSLGRMGSYKYTRMFIISQYYVFKKNFPQTLKHKFAFYLSICGLFLMCIRGLNVEGVKGLLSGLILILKSDSWEKVLD